jgi:hypothetical protein
MNNETHSGSVAPTAVARWWQSALRDRPGSGAKPRSSTGRRWPRTPALLTTALLCCVGGMAGRSFGQQTVPWKVEQVAASAAVDGGYWESGFGSNCQYVQDQSSQHWFDEGGLAGSFSASASVSYECCDKGGYYYGYGYGCTQHSAGAWASISVSAQSISVSTPGCMEYESCSSDASFRVVFDRPMRMVWSSCCAGTDCCGDYGCAIDGSTCGSGSAEFPGAGIYVYDGYYGQSVYHYLTSYSFYFSGSAGEWSGADNIRFERMYPADVMPDGQVDGFDIAAILSKWGGSYDPQRTPEDVNLDGQVSAEDLSAVLFAWGTPG